MKILTAWLRHYLPTLPVTDRQLADDLTLRGIAVEGVHELGPNNGHLFEMDITTNRVDAMNHYGIAREAATIYNLPLAPLNTKLPVGTLVDAPFPIRIAPDAKGLCGRFTAQVLRGVTIAPSTGPIAEYFTLLGQKQISNAVDASNFVLLGMGHPTHAFDLDKIEGGIVVRLAHKGEKLKLLDGTERTLEADDLVVADEKKALALAGVMGGWDSMITPETKNILIEAAWFDPASVRRSSRRHLLHTDASHRFERGADFNAAPVANALVAQLILQSGGKIEGELIDVIDPEVAAKTASRPTIELSVKQVQRHLGTTIDPEGITSEIVARYLSSLGCELILHGLDIYLTKLPSWRLDLEREIDLIEEVARVYGYNGFANTLPAPLPSSPNPRRRKRSRRPHPPPRPRLQRVHLQHLRQSGRQRPLHHQHQAPEYSGCPIHGSLIAMCGQSRQRSASSNPRRTPSPHGKPPLRRGLPPTPIAGPRHAHHAQPTTSTAT